MNKPPAKIMLLGHPVVAVPTTLAGGVAVAAGLYGGSLLMVILGGAVGSMALRASEQAGKYRAWRNEWAAMGGETPGGVSGGRIVGVLLLTAALILLVARPDLLVAGAHHAVHWLRAHPVVLLPPGLILAAILFQFARFFPRRPRRRSSVVKIVASPTVASPTIGGAYRALPDYCQALLRGQA